VAKSIFTDGACAVMHFNSSIEAYYAARELQPFDFECCYCHHKFVLEASLDPGECYVVQCNHCQNQVEYRTLHMNREIATYFDVRGGTLYGSPLSVGGIMHIALPTDHPEFNVLIDGLTNNYPIGVPPSEPGYPLLDFISRVINTAAERFNARSRERVTQEIYFQDAQNILNLSQSFTDFGKLVSPRPIVYPPSIKFKRDCMIANAADQLEQFLLGKYGSHLTEHEVQEIKFSLLEICARFVGQEWAERIVAGELVKRCRLFYGGSFRPHPRVTRIIGHVR
jgi:hypothetical protein